VRSYLNWAGADANPSCISREEFEAEVRSESELMPTMMKTSAGRRRLIAAFLIAMAIADGIEIWKQRARIVAGYGDFSALYTAASLLRGGKGKSLYDLREQWMEQQKFAPNVAIRQGPLPYMRPPFEALYFLPFALFSYPTALAVWSGIKLVLLWLTVRMLPRPDPFGRIYPVWLEATLCLGLFPVFLDLIQGQDAILLLFLVTATLNRMYWRQDAAAGAILALGLFKFHLVAPIVVMIWLAGRARVLLGFLPGAAALVTISCAISGVSVLSTYPAYVLKLNRATGVGVIAAQTMPNLRGLLTEFLGHQLGGPILWLLLFAALAAVLLTAWIWRPLINTGFTGLAPGYCLALLSAILTSFYAYSYDMTMLIVPLLLLGGRFWDQPDLTTRLRRLIATALLMLICTPLYWELIRGDYRCLLAIPMLLLALGIAKAMRSWSATSGIALPVTVTM